jgi:hypothetical protein
LGPFLQRNLRLSLAEQLGVLRRLSPPPTCTHFSVAEMRCVKAGRGTEGHYKLVKDGECIVFLVL